MNSRNVESRCASSRKTPSRAASAFQLPSQALGSAQTQQRAQTQIFPQIPNRASPQDAGTQTSQRRLDPDMFTARTPIPLGRLDELLDVEALCRYKHIAPRPVAAPAGPSGRQLVEAARREVEAQEKVDVVLGRGVWRSQYLQQRINMNRAREEEREQEKEKEISAFKKQQVYACGTGTGNLFDLRKELRV